jgi:hypothetical protein
VAKVDLAYRLAGLDVDDVDLTGLIGDEEKSVLDYRRELE